MRQEKVCVALQAVAIAPMAVSLVPFITVDFSEAASGVAL